MDPRQKLSDAELFDAINEAFEQRRVLRARAARDIAILYLRGQERARTEGRPEDESVFSWRRIARRTGQDHTLLRRWSEDDIAQLRAERLAEDTEDETP